MNTVPPAFARGLAILPWLAVIAVLLALPGCGRENVRFSEGVFDGDEAIEAIDGGRVLIGGETYRLAGVSTPRPAPEARCWAEALLAQQAHEALSLALLRKVEIVPGHDDPPGVIRLLVDGRSLSRDLVEQGLAASASEAWDWCGPLDPSAAGAPRLTLSTSRR